MLLSFEYQESKLRALHLPGRHYAAELHPLTPWNRFLNMGKEFWYENLEISSRKCFCHPWSVCVPYRPTPATCSIHLEGGGVCSGSYRKRLGHMWLDI